MGQVRTDSNQQIAAKHRVAESRRCPKCGRGSAIKRFSDDLMFGSYCRWEDCGYENITVREWADD